jgi:HEAT repeat protein
MSIPALTQFRMFLDRLDPSDRVDQLRFFRLLAQAGEEGIGDIRTRLLKASSSRDSKLLYVETAFYYPWREWIDTLGTLLRREGDPAIFTIGAWALGRMGGDASATLGGLYSTCTEPTFKETLSLEILRTDPHQAFKYHLHHLLEGSGNPRVANEAASELGKLVNGDHLKDLASLARHEDLLIARHALKLLSLLRTPEAGAFFLAFLQETHAEILTDRDLKELLASLHPVTGPALLEALVPHLAMAFGSTCPEALANLQGGGVSQRSEAAAQLRSKAQNFLEVFLVESLTLVLEAHWIHWPTLLANAGEALHQRSRQASFAVDTCAQALGALAGQGLVDRSAVLEGVKAAYQAQTGREGVARVFGALVDPGDGESLEILLAGQDGTLRAAALDALGARAEAALVPFLLRACRDPIVETAQRAMVSLGRTPGAVQVVVDLLRSGNGDEIHLALSIAGINRLAEIVPELLSLLATSSREDQLLACAETLGLIGAPQAIPALLELLHSGQSQRMQVSLATALRDFGSAEAAVGLADRANQLRNPQIHLLAAEALIQAHGVLENPLPAQESERLRQQVQGCWEDKNPWAMRYRLVQALHGLWSEDPALYQEMAALISATLAEKRCQAVWSSVEQTTAKSVARDLAQRG